VVTKEAKWLDQRIDLQAYHLIGEQKCYEEVHKIRWPNGGHCPHFNTKLVNKRGFHTHQAHQARAVTEVCVNRTVKRTNLRGCVYFISQGY
jgi:hypothetical protein